MSLKLVFFPTAACRAMDGTWRVPIHAWIYRPAEFSRLRSAGVRLAKLLLRRRLRSFQGDAELLQSRLGSFLGDNQRGARLTIEIAGRFTRLPRSRPSGHVRGMVAAPAEVTPGADDWLIYRAVELPAEGRALLLPATGLSVVSDIDDTIKVTQVRQRRQMLRNTFARRFACVPQMAELYRRWAEAGAAFHYVTASPWHLYPFLAEFLKEQGFPAGSWHMRDFRLAGGDLAGSFRSARRVKEKHIVELFGCYPRRRFVLVGDSGEADPAMYAEVARRFPVQVEKILIRDLGGESKWQKVFASLPEGGWDVLGEADEITSFGRFLFDGRRRE